MPASETSDFDLLGTAAAEAAELARTLFARGVETWTKSDSTPVTEADIAVDELLRKILTGARPDYGWLSEETADDTSRLSRKRVWVVDPIDGTRGFVRGTDQWCISAALVQDGRPVLGIVVNPILRQTYEAVHGAGAFLNGNRLKTTDCDDLAGCRLMMHDHILKSRKWAQPWPDVEVSMSTSMALRLCNVAAGEVDATVTISGKSDWDLAAADLLVHEAGGLITTLTGAPLRYNRPHTRHLGIVAAGIRFHEQLLARTKLWKQQNQTGDK